MDDDWVTKIEPNQCISFEWPADVETDTYRSVDINFETPSTDTTFVKIEEISFDMEEEATIEHIVGQNEGCSYMLEKLKTIIV